MPVNALQLRDTHGCSASRGGLGSDSLSSISESDYEDRDRVSDSSTEDLGSGLWLERLCTLPGEVPGA